MCRFSSTTLTVLLILGVYSCASTEGNVLKAKDSLIDTQTTLRRTGGAHMRQEAKQDLATSWKNCLEVSGEGQDAVAEAKEAMKKKHQELKAARIRVKQEAEGKIAERLVPEPISEKQQKMLAEFDTCIKSTSDEPELSTIKYRRARAYYEYNQIDQALLLFKDLAENYPSSKFAVPAAILLFDCWAIKIAAAGSDDKAEEYLKTLERQADKFRTMPELTKDKDFANQLFRLEMVMPPTEDRLAYRLGGKDALAIIRAAQRVEGVRVVMVPDKSGFNPRVEARGQLFEIDPKLAIEVKALLGNRATYEPGGTSCMFNPSVKLIFQHIELGTLELQLCLSCADLVVLRAGKVVGSASFNRGWRKVVDLAIKVFPAHRDIEEMLQKKRLQAELWNAERARWRAGMPKSLLPFWDVYNRTEFDSAIPSLQAELKKEFPQTAPRILALLTWYGSGAGPWTNFASYEVIAETLLMDYSTAELIAALESANLTQTPMEGAARLFAGGNFSKKRPADSRALPAALKKRLLAHILKTSTDPQKQDLAKCAFSGP